MFLHLLDTIELLTDIITWIVILTFTGFGLIGLFASMWLAIRG
jgi:hypothetical protein